MSMRLLSFCNLAFFQYVGKTGKQNLCSLSHIYHFSHFTPVRDDTLQAYDYECQRCELEIIRYLVAYLIKCFHFSGK